MTRIMVDPVTLSRLASVDGVTELCDLNGNRIGYFHPFLSATTHTHFVPDISEEELDRYAREPGGRPLADILRDLEKLK